MIPSPGRQFIVQWHNSTEHQQKWSHCVDIQSELVDALRTKKIQVYQLVVLSKFALFSKQKFTQNLNSEHQNMLVGLQALNGPAAAAAADSKTWNPRSLV